VPDTLEQIRTSAALIVPEIILLATMCFLFLVGPFVVAGTDSPAGGFRKRWGVLSLLALGAAVVAWVQGGTDDVQGTLFHIDHLVWYTRALALTAGVLFAFILRNQIDDSHAPEAFGCLLGMVAGTNLVTAANDLASLFLALELVSIPTYVLLYLPRRDRIGGESTLKYFMLSIFSSALVLYGLSWLFGATGSTNFNAIQQALASRPHAAEGFVEFAFALLLAGLCFRITAVPFHFYAPDVFQGTTAANAAILSFLPKVVGFMALLRLLPLAQAMPSDQSWVPEHSAKVILAIISLATMFVGNLMALRQKHLYRLMAYSSVAHAGYMLIGLVVGDILPVGGRDALLFYLAVYGLMTTGVFALLSAVGNKRSEPGRRSGGASRLGMVPRLPCTQLDDLRGLSRSKPAVALLLAICLFSLTGLPPTAGFLGKLNLFLAAWSDDTHIGRGLAIALAINAAISAWYYLRMVALMFLESADPEATQAQRTVWLPWFAGAACALATIVIFIAPMWLWRICVR
jgi:NADH-quinone oxidoreductase subunit N